MNNLFRAGSILCMIAILGGCGGTGSPVDQVVNAQIEAENVGGAGDTVAATAAKTVRESAGQPGTSSPDGAVQPGMEMTQTGAGESSSGIDMDLTKMSSVMIYSEVYNIMINPEDYLGKTIKIGGPYYASYWEETGNYYHYVIIEDATACCTQGLEFIWDDGAHVYPDEYPEDYTEVEVVGTFRMYEEEGMAFYYLDTKDIVCK